MPILFRNRLIDLDQHISKMTMSELIKYEAVLWKWMDKTGGAANIAGQLNTIHREVEWRAQERDWRDAAYPGRGPGAVAKGSR